MMGGAKVPAVGSKVQVWNGNAKHTSGGLTRKDLMRHKGRIVSRRKHVAGKKAIMRLRKLGYVARKGTFKLFRKKHGGGDSEGEDKMMGGGQSEEEDFTTQVGGRRRRNNRKNRNSRKNRMMYGAGTSMGMPSMNMTGPSMPSMPSMPKMPMM